VAPRASPALDDEARQVSIVDLMRANERRRTQVTTSEATRTARRAAATILLLSAALAQAQDAKPPARPPTPSQATAPAPYAVVKKLKIGGEGRWDLFAVDARTHRLYVPRSDHVLAIDAETGAVVGQVKDTKGVHGVALVPDLNRGFTSNGQDASMTVFDLKTLEVLGKVKAGTNPDAILHDPASMRVFCFNGKSKDVTALDAAVDFAKEPATERLDLGGKPELAVADGKGRIFVNIEEKNEVVRFDAKSLKITGRFALAPGEEPSGLAIDVENHRLYAACGNKMMVVLDAETGLVLATPPIGAGVDGAGFDPATGTAFCSNGEGTLSVVRETGPMRFEVVQTLATQKGAKTMALDPATHRIYLPTAEFGPAPAVTLEQPHPRPRIVPDSFTILVVDR
jgi:DNA-binding beta-propeller fold protein YncE